MKKHSKIVGIILSVGLFLSQTIGFAGNEQRAGQAGASELLINPYVKSSGMAGSNVASVKGIEAMYLNVAGIAFTRKTELNVASTQWLQGTDININSIGFTQKVGVSGVMALSLMSFSFGEIEKTTTDLPDGGFGSYKPQILNLGLSYAKEFSNSIYGGFTLKILSEGISDVKSSGIALDAGIQYVANEKLQFGITLKNVGPPMKFSGDGLSFRGSEPEKTYDMTVLHRSEIFELPSLIKIGFNYNMFLSEKHRLSPAFNFTSNSFTNDQFHLGAEYSFRDRFMLRGGYQYEKGMFSTNNNMTIFSGPSFGSTIRVPMNSGGSIFDFDFSYRATTAFGGVYSFGARINL